MLSGSRQRNVRYAHHPVVVKGFVDTVRICRQDKVIAEHERLWGKEGIQFNPILQGAWKTQWTTGTGRGNFDLTSNRLSLGYEHTRGELP